MHNRRFVTGALMVAALLPMALVSGCGRGNQATALGTIERDRVLLKATASEIIVEQPVREGEFVHQGTLLVKLDDRRQQARVAAANAEKVRAASRWEELRNGARIEDIDAAKAQVTGAQAALTVAEKNYARAVELRSKNLSTQATLDQATANRDSAEATLQAASKQLLALTNGTRKEELEQAEAVFKAAEAQWELEKLHLEELNIVATREGYLDSLPWNLGERVIVGSNVAILLAGKAPYARVYVPEPWRARMEVGETLQIKVDGVDDSFSGSLRWISSEPAFTPYYALNERDRSRLVYLAEVDIDQGERLPIGIPAEVVLGDRE